MENHDNEYFRHEEEGLMSHETTPNDRLQVQISLATDLFLVMHGDKKLKQETKRDFRNEIMNYWADEGYSKVYRELEQDDNFKNHMRLQGDIFRITVDDILQYKKDGKLPE